jgi:hypothetical protein
MLTTGHQAGKMACVPYISLNQLIAYNLMRIRKALGLSQEQGAERLEPFLGARWSKAVYSVAERSYYGKRVRQFTAAELTAFAAAFEVPVLYFFLAPRPDDRIIDGEPVTGVRIGEQDVPWRDLLGKVFSGQQGGAIGLRLPELHQDERPTLDQYPPLRGYVVQQVAQGILTRELPDGPTQQRNPETGKHEPTAEPWPGRLSAEVDKLTGTGTGDGGEQP